MQWPEGSPEVLGVKERWLGVRLGWLKELSYPNFESKTNYKYLLAFSIFSFSVLKN